ncbi:MAG: tRNA pseudouridine(38-40) synthase TruA [Burkholderiales bacterium]
MRIALGLEYDGATFCGWQSQPENCSIQDALDQALSEITAEPITSTCAGRTDAGVHALGQVVHFDTSASRPTTAWTRGVNALLPQGVAVTWAHEVSTEFHARFSARDRRYIYWLLNRSPRPGLLHNRVGWFHQALDHQAMEKAAQCLLGRRDFSAFRAAECQAKTPIKTLRSLAIRRQGDLLRFDFSADAFLQHMVRNLVGALVYVGSGRQPVTWIKELLEHRDRTRSAPTFSPAGLYLAAVTYDPQWQLPPGPDPDPTEQVLAATIG